MAHVLSLVVAVLIVAVNCSGPARQQSPQTEEDGPVVPPDTSVLVDLPYVDQGHERQRLDLYMPGNSSGPVPVIIWIHPGGWQQGGKHANRMLPLVTSFVTD